MIKTNIFAVGKDDLPDAWKLAEGYLQGACNASNREYTLESVAEEVYSGNALLWVIFRLDTNKCVAAGVTKLVVYPSGKKACLIALLGGTNRKLWLHHLREIEDYARNEGCEEVTMQARHGWMRDLKNYARTHQILRLAV